MKAFIKISIGLSFFFLFTSFLGISNNSAKIHDLDEIIWGTVDTNEVIITYEKPDVCNLNYLGQIKVKENFLFYHNNGLKKNTFR